MSGLRRRMSGLLEAGRKAGFFVLLVAGSAALGLVIALPLWRFATSAREAYTITVLALAAAGIVYLAVRAALRRRGAREPGRPPRSVLSGALTVLMVVIGVAGLYAAAALLAHRTWILGAVDLAAWAGLLWVLGLARRAAKARARAR